MPLVTSQLVAKNKEFDVSSVLLIVGVGELMIIEDSSFSVCGFQLLPLATNKLVGNNREFDVSGIF